MKLRDKVFNKFGGKCSYCGTELVKGWHIDHAEPIIRYSKYEGGNYVTKDTGAEPTYEDFQNHNVIVTERIKKTGFCHKPENKSIDNLMPACASCNINKSSMNIELFRAFIGRFINQLQRDSVHYRIAKRYGLIEETGKKVQFYFETLTPLNDYSAENKGK